MRTPEEIAELLYPDYNPAGGIREAAVRGAEKAQREFPREPQFKPADQPDKYRDLLDANLPRVSGCMWFAIPGEQPIIVTDEQATLFMKILSEDE